MPPSPVLTALQARLNELQKLTYSPTLKQEVEKFVADVPEIKDDTPRAEKVIIYILRAKAFLLLPTYSAEAESDLNRALKLNPADSADTYVSLSECLWRKNQEEEAIDAVQSALSSNEKHIGALCQLSRLVRALASKQDTDRTEQQKAELLQQSVAKAKEAIAVDESSGEAWSALGLAHIQVAVATGFGFAGMKLALAAMRQAVTLNPTDPDIHYNYAVVLEATGAYAEAAVEYATAAEIDPLLKGANKSADNCRQTIERHVLFAKQASRNESLKKDLLVKIPAKAKAGRGMITVPTLADVREINTTNVANAAIPDNATPPKPAAVSLIVVGLISPQGVYPLCYQCIDRTADSCMLLVPRLQNTAIQKHDVVTLTLPPCAMTAVDQLKVKPSAAEPLVDAFSSTIIHADPDALMVNGRPVPEKLYVPAAMSSRLFQ